MQQNEHKTSRIPTIIKNFYIIILIYSIMNNKNWGIKLMSNNIYKGIKCYIVFLLLYYTNLLICKNPTRFVLAI